MLLEGIEDQFGFFRGRRSAGGGAPGERESFGIGFSSFDEDALREVARGFDVLDVVHENERLEGGVAAFSSQAEAFPRGSVEGCHGRWRGGAFPECVEAPAIQGIAVVPGIACGVASGEADGFPDVVGLVGSDAFAADFRIEEA